MEGQSARRSSHSGQIHPEWWPLCVCAWVETPWPSLSRSPSVSTSAPSSMLANLVRAMVQLNRAETEAPLPELEVKASIFCGTTVSCVGATVSHDATLSPMMAPLSPYQDPVGCSRRAAIPLVVPGWRLGEPRSPSSSGSPSLSSLTEFVPADLECAKIQNQETFTPAVCTLLEHAERVQQIPKSTTSTKPNFQPISKFCNARVYRSLNLHPSSPLSHVILGDRPATIPTIPPQNHFFSLLPSRKPLCILAFPRIVTPHLTYTPSLMHPC